MESMCDRLCEISNLLNEFIDNPEHFIEPQPDKAEKFKGFTKFTYDLALELQKEHKLSKLTLPKLLTKKFDEEQIWQQLELENNVALKHFAEKLKQLDVIPDNGNIDENILKDKIPKSNSEASESSDEGYVFDDDDVSDEKLDISASTRVQKFEKSNADLQEKVSLRKVPSKHERSSEVDDQFFKLSKLEEFLQLEDLKEEKGDQTSDEESDIDMFQDIPSDDDDGSKSNIDEDSAEGDGDLFTKKHSSRDVMYEDFFDPPDSADEDITGKYIDNEDGEQQEKDKEYDTRDYDPMEDDDNSNQSAMEKGKQSSLTKQLFAEDEEPQEKTVQTAFERQQEKEQKRIQEMEESLLQPKPWQLTGEVAASNRPQNSLVHQPTTFDVNAKPDLISTDELTAKVEDIVIMAIKNKAWSDVERKVKPREEELAPYRRAIQIDTNKSKKSLPEVYEEEYLKIQESQKEEKEDPKHVEIKKLMGELLPELNALFAHIPKPPVPEIKVVSNLPAITVEGVAPVSVSDATLLAPEEIKKKPKGVIIGQTERSKTDKKRERRKKKIFQKMKQKRIDEKMRELSASNPELAKKQEKIMALKKIKKAKNARVVNSNETAKIKSSKDFFSRLDDITQINKSKKSVKLK